ncbi:PREDICTED: uncharacterized protein LOC109207522 [Nicotiana attenuata]|uniref:Uncharacterized protein n=1 Tax=Nicotiana attenuata TaxID=49451 RepID=A0A314KSJ9_NICAT|nr:PREDICTED: uncharacterized protein LOC109207522 [Nicotiana attenuata]OIT32302.1 hypothetical protein A4A49_16999 [Nicotiana attenuata]
MALYKKTISSPSSNPLFSIIITLYTLILLYFPTNYQTILFSPVFLSTSLLLLSLLRLGQTQKTNQEENHQGKEKKPNLEEFISTQKSSSLVSRVDPNPKPVPFQASGDHDSKWESRESHVDPNTEQGADFDPNPKPVPFILSGDHDYKRVPRESSVDLKTEQDPDFDPKLNPFYAESFVEWNVRAPLQVIHEEFEDGEFYYPETDTGTESSSGGDSPVTGNWDSPENLCFRWEEEGKEGLIEIELDGKRTCEAEEENLIEIDLTPANFPAR